MKQLLQAFLLYGLLVPVLAQPIVLNNPDKTYPLFPNASSLNVAPGQKITLDSLIDHPEKYVFTPIRQKPVQPGPNQNYWFKVDLKTPTTDDYFLHFLYASDMLVRVYEVTDRQLIASWQVDFYGVSTQDRFQRSRSIIPLRLHQGQTHTLYFFIAKMGIPDPLVTIVASKRVIKELHYQDFLHGLFGGFIVIMAIYSLLLGIRLGDRDNILYSIWVIVGGSSLFSAYGDLLELPGNWAVALKHNHGVHSGINVLLMLLFMFSFLQLKKRAPWLYTIGVCIWVLFAVATAGVFGAYLAGYDDHRLQLNLSVLVALSSPLFGVLAGSVVAIRGYRPGLFYALGSLSLIGFTALFILSIYGVFPFTFWNRNALFIANTFEIIFYVLGLTYKVNMLKKNQEEAIREQLRLTQENQLLVETQNRVLEEKVEQRTAELKASQAQLVQKEKLASLGELTAGIAHEIQNPLNFVNNFSEVSAELVDELKEEAQAGRTADVLAIADDLSQNLQKIGHHGRRASAIVKGMLEHSKAGAGEKEDTDLIRLTDECVKIAYQGYRSKHRTFSCDLVTSFQPDSLYMPIVTQDIGRVIVNILNNAFYSVHERSTRQRINYQPQIGLSIARRNGYAELIIRDNGTGIPESIREKIFQPFFTTKPTGEGTGLGLSLSHDIISKGYGGSLEVKSQEGQGSEFIIRLPA